MWNKLPKKNRDDYKIQILNFSSLTPAFSQKASDVPPQTLTPIINSKFQETAFKTAFGATIEDIGNTSYDASLRIKTDDGELKFLVGIKTFAYTSGAQKVAQFKANHDEWDDVLNQIKNNAYGRGKEEIDSINKDLYYFLAKKISSIRNQRIRSSVANLRGFRIEEDDIVECVYHVLMPANSGENPVIYVGETSYDPINIEKISIIGCTNKSNPTNFSFTDGNHTYRFTAADSQLLMDFNNRQIAIECWKIVYLENAYDFFRDLSDYTDTKKQITESVSWKITNRQGEVERYSGFNAFYGVGSKKSADQRVSSVKRLIKKYENIISSDILNRVENGLMRFLLEEASSTGEKREKEALRYDIVKTAKNTGNTLFECDISKMVFRPIDELYIPIPNSRKFHKDNPDFFAENAGTFKPNSVKLALPPVKREFNLVFEPSGDVIRSFVTQDAGKAIESCESQAILGNWILRDVFQLDEYQPLTRQKLEEIGINGIRLYKTNVDDDVHLEFVWIDENEIPEDYWE